MKGEIPLFKRCCFCLPLRYGLLAWGYFKMTADAFIIILMSYTLLTTLMMISIYGAMGHITRIYTEIIISIIVLTVFFTDFVVTIVFIVAGHKKNVKLIRVFYFLSIGMWAVTIVLTAIQVVITTYNSILSEHQMHYWEYNLIAFSFLFVVIVVQSYFLLLLRSEIIKLRNSGEFRFVNNAAEAECSIECEEIKAREETAIEGV